MQERDTQDHEEANTAGQKILHTFYKGSLVLYSPFKALAREQKALGNKMTCEANIFEALKGKKGVCNPMRSCEEFEGQKKSMQSHEVL